MIGKFCNAKLRKTEQWEKPIYIFLDLSKSRILHPVFSLTCTITSV